MNGFFRSGVKKMTDAKGRDDDREVERLRMVSDQIEKRGVHDSRVLAVMGKVHRHRFLPEKEQPGAYKDGPLSIGFGQTISQPYMVAVMTECLGLRRGDKVLEIGTGSGYQTAVLAEVVGTGEGGGRVYTVERIETLSRAAAEVLAVLGYDTIAFAVRDGSTGWEEKAPFDAILVTAGAPEIPPSLVEQLVVGGRIVIPVGSRFHQTLLKVVRKEDGTRQEKNIGCIFVPLIGEEGWND